MFILFIFSCLFYVENAQMNDNAFDNDDDDDLR